MSKWKKVGEIGVDAGMVMVADPCYVLHRATPVDGCGSSWAEFCEIADRSPQLNYNGGHPGLGVVVPSGYGDGTYPVYVQRDRDGGVAALLVVFSEAPGLPREDTK